MADIGDLRYDRVVAAEFASHFAGGGFAEALVDYARGKYPIDFQYRKDPKSGRQWASLYVGLTAVVNVYDLGATGLRLTAHKTYCTEALGWDSEWSTAAPAATWIERWNAVERYLERVIPKVVTDGRYVRSEGIVQASVSGYTGDGARAILDREVVPSFRDDMLKKQIADACRKPLLLALPGAGVPGTSAPSLGMECDALAIDKAGHLVAIEIKPGSVGSLAWVAAQATMYARVLQHWIDHDDKWQETIRKTYAQRAALGLVPPEFTMPAKLKQTVVPAVAFSRVASPVYVERMYAVQDALLAAGVGDPALRFYTVAPSGRLDLHVRQRTSVGPGPHTAHMTTKSYIDAQNELLVAWKARTPTLPDAARLPGTYRGGTATYPICLPREFTPHNLLPDVRDGAIELFAELDIEWHDSIDRGPSNHLRDSQVQCVNALFAMVNDPARIKAAFRHAVDIAEVLPIEDDRYLTFEYIGPTDYFDEGKGKPRRRGTQCTSVDAAFRYRTSAGKVELALVEWKYTENYLRTRKANPGADATRTTRYGAHYMADDSPINSALAPIELLFDEPFYQLMRQQLLAHRLESDPAVEADVVRVVHVLAPQNLAYQRSLVRAEHRGLGATVEDAWTALLRATDRFVKVDPSVFLSSAITSAEYVDRYRADA